MILKGQIRIAGTGVEFKDEPTKNTGNIMYQITDKSKRAWNMGIPLIITPQPELDDTYKIDYANGYILFDKQKDRGEITVSGEYFPTTVIGKVLGYNLDKAREFKEFTPLGALNKENIPAGITISGEIEQLEIKDTYFLDAFENAEKILLDFQMGERIESHWVYLEGLKNEHNGGELVKKKISFRSAD